MTTQAGGEHIVKDEDVCATAENSHQSFATESSTGAGKPCVCVCVCVCDQRCKCGAAEESICVRGCGGAICGWQRCSPRVSERRGS